MCSVEHGGAKGGLGMHMLEIIWNTASPGTTAIFALKQSTDPPVSNNARSSLASR